MSDGLKMKYFVLKPEGDNVYAAASRAALRAYAISVYHENQELSDDLCEWVERTQTDHDLSLVT